MLLLGVDEGTTGVKAALFDEQLKPVREARRDKVNRHPKPGWVEQDGEEVLQAVVEAVGELLEWADEEVVACGLDHQGESVLAWDADGRLFVGSESSGDPAGTKKGFADVWVARYVNSGGGTVNDGKRFAGRCWWRRARPRR